MKNNIKSLQLACRMSITPNILGYCGRATAEKKLRNCITDGKCDEVSEEFKHFIVVYPYLKTISQIIKKPVFSYPVIESYWLGNDFLKKIKPTGYQLLIDNLAKQGAPDFLIKDLKKNPPKKFIPTHLFQVLFVGVGRASSSVPFNLNSVNNCMIRWGMIKKINKNTAIINLNSLTAKYKIKKNPQIIAYDKKMIPGLTVNNTVAVHWGKIIKILTKKEEYKLFYWSNQVLEKSLT